MAVRKKTTSKTNTHWEREALEKIALSALGEQKIARRWGIFFKLLTFIYIFGALALIVAQSAPQISGFFTGGS